jgi:hypothetical protein
MTATLFSPIDGHISVSRLTLATMRPTYRMGIVLPKELHFI